MLLFWLVDSLGISGFFSGLSDSVLLAFLVLLTGGALTSIFFLGSVSVRLMRFRVVTVAMLSPRLIPHIIALCVLYECLTAMFNSHV
jgi:hypothetical protein